MSKLSVLDSPYSWFRLVLTLIISTIGSVGVWAIIIVLPLVQADLGIDRSTASLLYALTMVGFAAGNLIVGRFVDHFAGQIDLHHLALADLVAGPGPALDLGLDFGLGLGFGFGAEFQRWTDPR